MKKVCKWMMKFTNDIKFSWIFSCIAPIPTQFLITLFTALSFKYLFLCFQNKSFKYLLYAIIISTLSYIVNVTIGGLNTYYRTKSKAIIKSNISNELLNKYLKLPVMRLQEIHSGKVVAHFNQDIDISIEAIYNIVDGIISPIILVTSYLIITVYFAWEIVIFYVLMTFNFLALQYILPMIGVCLLYIGFRQLRNENKWFNVAWIFSIISIIIEILKLIYISTPLHITFDDTLISAILITVFQVSFIIVFRNGVIQIFKDAGEIINRDPLLALAIWRVITTICGLTELGSVFFISIPLILYYFYVFRQVYKIVDDLGSLNYKLKVVQLKINSKMFIVTYSVLSILVVAICCVLSNSCRLDSREFINPMISETRTKLINLGFPKEIIKDISDDDINMLQNAIYVQCDTALLMYDSEEDIIYYSDGSISDKKGKTNLEATTIFVENNDGKMYGFEYFQWIDDSAYWKDIFTISGSQRVEVIDGRLLYEKDGKIYSAAIPKLNNKVATETDILGNESQREKITGAVSYPWRAENQRGYVFYLISLNDDVCVGVNLFNYTHYSNPFRIPYTDTGNENLFGNENLRQHCTNYFTKAYREAQE